MNHMIRISPIRLIGPNNEQIGVTETHDALRMAEEAGLDLVEVVSDSRPPVCKIMDYGKYKYELSKKKQPSSKGNELKEIRLGRSIKIDKHDIAIRSQQARRFLMEGNKVQVIQRFKGREFAHKDLGLDNLREFFEALEDIAKVEQPPRPFGRQFTMLLAPDKPKVESARRRLEKLAKEEQEAEEERLNAQIAELDARDADEADDDDDQVELEAAEQEEDKPEKTKKGKQRDQRASNPVDDEIAELLGE
ncbi:MAG: hypothetical protein Phyf2KO_14390 [Phycisphaerales bacterium]